ncbi:hypothetical protein BFJ72_g7412 [Fusarium proliferatum]|uniref:Uncharacterized protein n=1 Tax=Gibberella intermedia TaxID=948311 RepID=A0A420T8U3_GIBIN|nr:hypothetical protein BFJ72_g7412 [Fusarium proliferatum]
MRRLRSRVVLRMRFVEFPAITCISSLIICSSTEPQRNLNRNSGVLLTKH